MAEFAERLDKRSEWLARLGFDTLTRTHPGAARSRRRLDGFQQATLADASVASDYRDPSVADSDLSEDRAESR